MESICLLPNPNLSLHRSSSYRFMPYLQSLKKPPEGSLRPAAFWNNLSEVFLTANALRELDRRADYPYLRKVPHSAFDGAADFIDNCSPRCLTDIKRLSRHGGPGFAELRHCKLPDGWPGTHHPSKSNTQAAQAAADDAMTGEISAYSRNFEQHVIDHNIYPAAYLHPDGEEPAPPMNHDAILSRLNQRRDSLSAANFSPKDFAAFVKEVDQATKEQGVIKSVIPIIEGKVDNPKSAGGGYPFNNLAPLTDGSLRAAKPDLFHGAHPKQLNTRARNDLRELIVPSKEGPIIVNFFLEAEGPDGSDAVLVRQACYNGALGARAMHALQDNDYDGNAYTVTATYTSGLLRLYAHHIKEPAAGAGARPEYIMTLLDGWYIRGNVEAFRRGVSAYRNARDWAKEKRDELISARNDRVRRD